MESKNNSNKSRTSFTEASTSKELSLKDNHWMENRSDHTKRDRNDECNSDRPSFKNVDGTFDKDRVNREEQPVVQSVPPAATFPSYNYNSADHLFVDSNRHPLSIVSSYNMMATVNTPWPVNSFDMAMNQHNISVNQSQPPMPMAPGLEMVQPSNSSMPCQPYAFMGIPGENMYGVVGMGNYCQYGNMPSQESMFFSPIKEVVHLTKSVLYPPNPNAPRPTTRERPLGCKTVFVGGLPEKITDEILKEIFDRCGTVETIRMSKKNFCHIRFADELFVENALYFSGYRLKIENKDEAPFTGRLHVDYAQARDDQYDYECKQRSLQRQARHQEQDYYRPPTPPVVHYTDHEASLICEKLKNEETFTLAAGILITWLEKGECTKKTASSFFSMIQSTHNHVRKLQLDKVKYEEQLNEAKKMLKKQLEGIIRQFTEIEKIYKAASLQKCWDQFTKAQRKNIEMWKKQTEELKNAHLEEVINEREDEEMELSDDENNENKQNTDVDQLKKQYEDDVHKYQEEIDSLRCQLEAAQNEMMVMRSDHKEESTRKDNEMAVVRQALQSSKKEELNLSQRCCKNEVELKELRAFKRRIIEDNPVEGHDSSYGYENNIRLGTSSNVNIEKEARFIGLISTFLHVHPFGANIDYICSYLHQIDSSIKSRDVENLLKRYPVIFREDSTGIGASLGKKWYFTGF